MNDAERRIAKSRSRTVNLVWPIIGPKLGGGDLIQIEGFAQLHPALKFLDCFAGIDHLIYQSGVGIGLASRVQNGDDFDYQTWTVRNGSHNGSSNTEYARHLKQLSTRGAIKPQYWCQAYVSPRQNKLLRAAIANTADIIAAVGDESIGFQQKNSFDGNPFWAISWKGFRDTGAWAWIYDDGTWLPPTTAKPTQLKLL
jgi:hypothetical protein